MLHYGGRTNQFVILGSMVSPATTIDEPSSGDPSIQAEGMFAEFWMAA